MQVQRVLSPVTGLESWTVLGDDGPIQPIEAYLAYLTDIERSPNTIKAYAHDLKDYFTFLDLQGLDWREVRLEDLGESVAWLRRPPGMREGNIALLPSVEHHCTEGPDRPAEHLPPRCERPSEPHPGAELEIDARATTERTPVAIVSSSHVDVATGRSTVVRPVHQWDVGSLTGWSSMAGAPRLPCLPPPSRRGDGGPRRALSGQLGRWDAIRARCHVR
ncbi:phage integrase family protein with SAM-like domain [Nonomuraea polychroma]|uniref:Phage integrase family protein with SAM-like domain n=1 Tax=Nonomuraea polychroma TaxID=46176 RepID=A0A438M640_9ACTN|nr:site-specific integrase [Nonomuraea polychroma]RVX40923.1 phage integrase family protein with SAM-like domain [Nonomuraea polychroma]